MTHNNSDHPGEARSRRRTRNEIYLYIFCALLGGVIGFIAAFADKGDANLFRGEWDRLVLDPTVAVVMAAALFLSLTVLPVWCFSLVDELVRERNYIGYTGGCVAVLGGYPAWLMLHAGGLAGPPHAMGVWAIAFLAMMAAFLFARWTA